MGSFKCNVCDHAFYLPASNAILNDEELVCPYCGSNNIGPCKFEELGMWSDNHFTKYTDHLAEVLQEKMMLMVIHSLRPWMKTVYWF